MVGHRHPQNNLRRRRGVATIWLILWGPALLLFFCVMLDLVTLWVAQIELKDSLDASSLAAVKHWGDSGFGETQEPRNVGLLYATANLVDGVDPALDPNYDQFSTPNQNKECSGNLLFGTITETDPDVVFDADVAPSCGPGKVFIEIIKEDAGVGSGTEPVKDDLLRIHFIDDNGVDTLSIIAIKFIIPPFDFVNQVKQRPFFDGSKGTAVNPASDVSFGDITFTFLNLRAGTANNYRTILLEMAQDVFVEGDDLLFGLSINQFNPPAIPGPQSMNDGEAWHKAPVGVEVTFYNSATMKQSTVTGFFIDDGDPGNDRAIANLSGGDGGTFGAVLARKTVPVHTFCGKLIGLGPFNVTARSVAIYNCATGRPALIREDVVECDEP